MRGSLFRDVERGRPYTILIWFDELGAQKFEDFFGLWDFFGYSFGIDAFAFDKNFKITGFSRGERDAARQRFFKHLRQTGGSGLVVSNRAVKNFNTLHGMSPDLEGWGWMIRYETSHVYK